MLALSDLLKVLFVVAMWGLSFIAIKLGVGHAPALYVSAWRFVFAALPAVFILPRPKTALKNIIAYGVLLGVMQFGLLFTALKLGMPAGLASLLMQLQAFFTVGLSMVFYKESPTAYQITGALVAFVGTVMIGSERIHGAALFPLILVILASLSWSGANLVSKQSGDIDRLAFVAWASLVAPLPLLILSFLFEGGPLVFDAWLHPPISALACAAYLGWIATIGGFGLWNEVMHKYPVAVIAPFSLLVPVFGFIGAYIVFQERISPAEIGGGLFILTGLMINVFGPHILLTLRSLHERTFKKPF